MMQRRTLAIMGDGGFWHNGLLTGVQSALFNGDDAVLLIFKNGYTSATGTQDIISTPLEAEKQAASDKQTRLSHTNMTIESTLQGLGVQWMETVHTYEVAKVQALLKKAFTSDFNGLKVIIAEGECQLERQRRIKPWISKLLKGGKRVVRVKYGVDEDVCNGDHACIRLSGCPTLTLKDNPDPLKVDPVATVIDGCVGCGLCGENAHAATLCPSFYRAEIIQNPKPLERCVGGFTQQLGSRLANRMSQSISLLVCALGGEGGGVLSEWLMHTARLSGYPAQSTSIPGVAQRTGATTYYIEVLPTPLSQLQGKTPVFSLNPVPGALDALVSSGLLETARQISLGLVSPERTRVFSSSARALTTLERMPMGDGRLDSAGLTALVQAICRRSACVGLWCDGASQWHPGQRGHARCDRWQRFVAF
jgi:NAD-dependent dihydropyrimidine dehydrogenase PreA subunit